MYTIYTKGVATGSLGLAAVGVLVLDEAEHVVLEHAESIGNATEEYAEYFAVVKALQLLAGEWGVTSKEKAVELKLEHQLVYSHLTAQAQIKDVSLIGHFVEIYNVRVASFPHLQVTKLHTSENDRVTQLATAVLDE
jgi:ribonuclease HI